MTAGQAGARPGPDDPGMSGSRIRALAIWRGRRSRDDALRAWHEQCFRDLKRFGFHWNTAYVWQPCPSAASRAPLVRALRPVTAFSAAVCAGAGEPKPSRIKGDHILLSLKLVKHV